MTLGELIKICGNNLETNIYICCVVETESGEWRDIYPLKKDGVYYNKNNKNLELLV